MPSQPPPLDAPTLASLHYQPTPTPPSALAIELSQATHRLSLLASWSLPPQTTRTILEIGCGQGTTTAALALYLAHHHPSSPTTALVTALDPAPPTYGFPVPLGTAQSHLASHPAVGRYIAFARADPVPFLAERKEETWDVAVLAHCVWYFSGARVLGDILAALRGRVKRVCLAEWGLRATEGAAQAHVLAALGRGAEEGAAEGEGNIRFVVGPGGVKRAAGAVGWRVEREGWVVPGEGLDDGRWEVGSFLAEGGGGGVVEAAREAARGAVEGRGGVRGVRCMDVWVGTFVEGG